MLGPTGRKLVAVPKSRLKANDVEQHFLMSSGSLDFM